ncbi:MAG: hypothetical protein E7672_07265 [Ruminococcaceae bacterium]|nr:hypothetical protein [Oscillospiraceae bacterium]
MKSKWSFVASIFQLTVGILATAAFIVLALSGDNMTKWIVTLILAIALIVLGILGIKDYTSDK